MWKQWIGDNNPISRVTALLVKMQAQQDRFRGYLHYQRMATQIDFNLRYLMTNDLHSQILQNLIIAMYRLNIAKTLYGYFNSENRKKAIILAHNNSFAHYTFLAINLSAINNQFIQTTKKIRSPLLQSFVSQLNSNRYMIKSIQKQNYSHLEIQSIENEGKASIDILNKYVGEIKVLKNHFKQLSDQVLIIVDEKNVVSLMQVCLKLQVIDYTVWSKIFQICLNKFQKLSQQEQSEVIRYSQQYIKGKFISFTHSPSKYLYRENYLVDLTNFRQLIKIFLTSIKPNIETKTPKMGSKQKNLQRINDIIEKVSKTYVLNFSQLIQMYLKNAQSFKKIVKNGSMVQLAEVLRLLSIIGLSNLQQFKQIEEVFQKGWTSQQQKLDNEIKYKLVSRILSFWANVFYHNEEIYYEIIKPFILAELQKNLKRRQYSIWLYNITASNIKDYQFQQFLLKRLSNDIPMSNKYLHIVNHYLSIINNSKGYCTFTCSQHQRATDIVSKHGKAYLNCMQRIKVSQENNQKKLAFINRNGQEENPPQQFWLGITRKAFENLNKKYQDDSNGIYSNFQFCVFQIDAMIFIKKIAIGVEIVGTHYSLKDQNASLFDQKQGKKNLKMKILKSYGINFIEINSTGVIEKNIASFGDTYHGIKFIQQKIEDLIKQAQ